MTKINIPESLEFYYTNSEAVNTVIKQTDDPKDYTPEQIINMEKARLQARQIQIDFYEMINDIWNKTFGEAIAESGVFSQNKYEKDATDYDLDDVWNGDDDFGKEFEKNDKKYTFSITREQNEADEDERTVLSLWFCIYDDKVGHYTADGIKEEYVSIFKDDDDDDNGYVSKSCINLEKDIIDGKTEIDLSELAEVAKYMVECCK